MSSNKSAYPILRALLTPGLMVGLSLALVACGFSLRQAAELPEAFDNTYLDVADPYAPLPRELRTVLKSNDLNIVTEADQAGAVISIPVDEIRREILSVDSSARVRQFQLIYRVEFEVKDAEGQELMKRQRLELSRDYTFDEQNVLGKAREDELLQDDLRRDMVRLIVLRLERALAQEDSAAKT